LPDIILPVADVESLNRLRPDMDALARMSCDLDVTGVHAFAIADDGYTAHVRNFGPRYNIPEESATGTANGALTHYLHRQGIIPCPTECHFLQGEAMGRPSVVTTALDKNGSIRVGGQSRIIAIGDLLV
jgi:PhzF family phenazine biosynthesis protein